ncbi:hypothetical protein D1872_263660 [compost metagenome]
MKPPSTGTTVPVTKPEVSASASHSSVPSRSSGTPKRRIGVCAMIFRERSVGVPSSCMSSARFCSVRKNPGATAFTRIPASAKCTANHCVKLLTAALAAL